LALVDESLFLSSGPSAHPLLAGHFISIHAELDQKLILLYVRMTQAKEHCVNEIRGQVRDGEAAQVPDDFLH